MDYRFSRGLKIISSIVLFFFLWTFELSGIAYAIKNDQQAVAKQTAKTKSEKKTGKNIEDIDDILKSTDDTDTKRNKVRAKKAEIETNDVEIRKSFSGTENTLKEKGLPPEILERHKKFVKKYEDNFKELQTNLDAIDKAKTKTEADTAIEKTKAHLAKVKPPKKHKPLDPNNLPVKSPDEKQVDLEKWTPPAKPVIPQGLLKKADLQSHKPILVAANGSLKGLLNSDSQLVAENNIQLALNTPIKRTPASDADLAEAPEIQFTPAIMAKAEELGYKPVKLYEWVRNNIEYVPTYGSIQGADMCLQTKQCNDTDTASLLIALFRVSGIHARYAYGTVERTAEQVKNWAGGFTDTMAALNFLASAGIPVKGMTEGGEIKYVQMEHVWVEAWIDYFPSRGARHRTGQGDTWIPLDASYKQYNYTSGIDIKSAVHFDAQTFIDQIKSSATINETEGYVTNINSTLVQQSMQDYQTSVQNYISQTYPNATVGDVLGKKEIIKQEFPYLLGTLNKRTIARTAEYTVLPDKLRHKVTFSVTSDNIYYDSQPLNITKLLSEVAGKKITLSYAPATSADEAVINSYLPKAHADGTPIQPSELPSSLPAYLIQLKPELRIDGVVVATGGAIGMGEIEDFNIMITPPTTSVQVVNNKVTAGEYNAIVLSVSRVSSDQITALKTKLEQTKMKFKTQDLSDLTKDDVLGEVLYTFGLSYFAELNEISMITASQIGVSMLRLPSIGRVFFGVNIDWVFNIPISAFNGNVSIDIGLIRSLVTPHDNDKRKKELFMVSCGIISSTLENYVLEQFLSTPQNSSNGISAVKALQMANNQGIPIYTITTNNVNSILPQLQIDQNARMDIINAVNSGKAVIVSKSNVSYNSWSGCGFVVINPSTGAGAYLLSSGINGGVFISEMNVLLLSLSESNVLPSGFLLLSNFLESVSNNLPCISALLDLVAAALSLMIALHAFVEAIFLLLTIPLDGLAALLLALELFVVCMIFILSIYAFNYYIEKFSEDIAECKELYL